MNKYYDINKLPKEPINFYMGTRKSKELLSSMYGVMLTSKKYKKKYHLRKEIKEFFSDAFLDIIMALSFVALCLSLMMLHVIIFG